MYNPHIRPFRILRLLQKTTLYIMQTKHLLLVLILFSAPTILSASAPSPLKGEIERFALEVSAEYAYNRTYAHFANINLRAFMPINTHFEMQANIRLSSANVYAGALTVRPKFPLPVGDLFLETDLFYTALARNRANDFCAAVALGYRMDYVSVRIGMFGRVMNDWNTDYHSAAAYVCEPFNMLYEIKVGCRPSDCPWNIWVALSNIDDFQMERAWQPIFRLGARYDIDTHWRTILEGEIKPTGIFHLNATLYSAYLRAGFAYRF